MMADSTSVGYRNLPNRQVEDFPLQLPPLRNLGAPHWDVKGEARMRSVVKFGGSAANYLSANVRKGPPLLAHGERGGTHVIAQGLRRLSHDPPTKSHTASFTSPLSRNRNAHRTIDPTQEEARNYHVIKYDKHGHRIVTRFTNEAQSKEIPPPQD